MWVEVMCIMFSPSRFYMFSLLLVFEDSCYRWQSHIVKGAWTTAQNRTHMPSSLHPPPTNYTELWCEQASYITGLSCWNIGVHLSEQLTLITLISNFLMELFTSRKPVLCANPFFSLFWTCVCSELPKK